ncbi:hypothetical protein BJ741DRAFT_599836 [Chytriomyces cf. hyalinus JEL632]|nr:hypothetical protein BJ741DRAFT_599836 [Chytriomyces cf. hyalinus JEL632]
MESSETLTAQLIGQCETESGSDLFLHVSVSAVLAWIRRVKAGPAGPGDGVKDPAQLPESVESISSVLVFLMGAMRALPHSKEVFARLNFKSAAVHRRVAKCLGKLMAIATGRDFAHAASNQAGKRKRNQRTPTASTTIPTPVAMSDEDIQAMPEELQELVRAFLMDPDVSPFAVYSLTAFPPSFLHTNEMVYASLLESLSKNSCTSTEVFTLLQPPYFEFPNLASENDELVLPQHIIQAITSLIKAGETQVAPILIEYPMLLHKALAELNENCDGILRQITAAFDSKPGCVGFTHKSQGLDLNTTAALRSLSQVMFHSKPILKISSLCRIDITSSKYTAIVTTARLTTLKWLVGEIIKFFDGLCADTSIEVDEDCYLEGPLPLLPDLIEKIDESYQQCALQLSIADLVALLPLDVVGAVDRVLKLALEPFGYTPEDSSMDEAAVEKWAWVNTAKLACLSYNKDTKPTISAYSDAQSLQETLDETENKDIQAASNDTPRYYKCIIPIQFVDDAASLAVLADAVRFENCDCVAIDCEWKPDGFKLIGEPDSPAATLQIAVSKSGGESKAFVLGLAQLDEKSAVEVLEPLFQDGRIIKLGFGFSEDTARLRLRFPSLSAELKNLSDLSRITSKQASKGYFQTKKRISLSDLVKEYLGVEMEKRIRLSNWEMRPLTVRQLTYAANDTLVLLEVYQLMQRDGDLETEAKEGKQGGGGDKRNRKRNKSSL